MSRTARRTAVAERRKRDLTRDPLDVLADYLVEQEGPARDLLMSVMAWVAEQESARRSERVKAGLARRKAQGLPVGRLKGAKDRKKRKRTGYLLRYAQAK